VTSVSGSGSGLTALNADNISSGTLNNARLPSTIDGEKTFSSNLEVGTANLFVDTTSGNVGVGTDSPQVSLDISNRHDSLSLPNGTDLQRPSITNIGMIRFNTDKDSLEQYTSIGWKIIDVPPIINSFSGIINENVSTTLTIYGLYFNSGCTVFIKGGAVNNVDRGLVTTFISSTQVTVNTNATNINYVSGASYDIKIVNPTGSEFTLTPGGVVDATPTWTTTAGALGTYYDRSNTISYQLSASDSDNDSITYSLTTGSFPTGVSVSTSGLISGDPGDVTSDTTYPFGISAIANNIAVERTFNFVIRKRYGLTSDRVATSVDQFVTSLDTNGLYYMNIGDGRGTQQYYVDFNMVGGPYVMIARNMASETGNSATFGIQNTNNPNVGDFTGTSHFNTNITNISATKYVVRNDNGYYAKFDLDSSSRTAIYTELQDTAGETSTTTAAHTAFTIPSGGIYYNETTSYTTWSSSSAIIELHHSGWNAAGGINYIIEVGINTRDAGSGTTGNYPGIESHGRYINTGDGTKNNGNADYHFIRI
jgi:hypothetical protein